MTKNIGEILIKWGFISKKDLDTELDQCEKTYQRHRI